VPGLTALFPGAGARSLTRLVRVVRPALLALSLAALAGCGGASGASTTAANARHATVHRGRAGSASLGPDALRGAAARRAAVPILMYHVINAAPPGTPYPELWTPAPRFAAEMAVLRRAGFRAVTLEQVLRAWRTGAALPHRPLVVSFDDGYLSQYTKAFPVLRRLGWPGVLNLEVHNISPYDMPAGFVRSLLRHGWEVDSHTVTHPDLTTVDPSRVRYELVVSRRELQRRFGSATALQFCYPAGRYDAAVEAAVRAAGYTAATTTQPGWATPAADRFALPRVRVNGSDTPAAVLAAVTAARPAG
jgi:peptidoglycan/xylan/chitin deacetylase (PgdA/CDA1 family)